MRLTLFWITLAIIIWIWFFQDYPLLLLGLVVLAILLPEGLRKLKDYHEHYSAMSRCDLFCWKNSDGKIADVFGCCDCITNEKMGGIITNDQESTRLNRTCLCQNGFSDWCYPQSTNFLLGL